MNASSDPNKSQAFLLALGLGMALPCFMAHADDAAAPPAANIGASARSQLAPVVITATKRATTVQTTPISIAAVTTAQITARGLANVDSLVRSVPGLAIRDAGGPGEEEYEIRGLNSQGGNSSMVGLYLGEIPLSSAMTSQLGKNLTDVGLYDISRVEVLRGPQGTLYGSSSMGGTIRVLPEDPQLNTVGASTEDVLSDTASGGGINHQESGMVNIPLGDTAAVRIVGSFTSDSGWVERRVIQDGAIAVDPGAFPDVTRPDNFHTAPLQEDLKGVNTAQINSIRAELLWEPTHNLTIEPMVLYQRVQQGAPPAVDVAGDQTNPTTPQVLGHWEIYDAPEPQTDTLGFASLKTVYQFPSFAVTSATGFWHRNLIALQDDTEQMDSVFGIPAYDAAAGGIGPNYSSKGPGIAEQDGSRQLSEEFRAASTSSGRLQWVVGYFYQDLHSDVDLSALAPQATPILGGPYLYVASIPAAMVQNAFFGHLSWRLSRHFDVAAGFRRYRYSLSNNTTEYGALTVAAAEGDNVPVSYRAASAANGTVPSVTLTYNVDPDHMVYVRIDKGFRLGGPEPAQLPVVAASNTNPLLAAQVADECALQAKILLTAACNPNILLQAPTTFQSDWLWSYEVGEKSTFLQRRVLLNLDAYLEDWNDPQLVTDVAGQFLEANGGDALIKGLEGSLQALLPGGFELSLNTGYTDARFVHSNALTGYPAGMQIPDTPRVSGSAILQWTHYLGNGHSLFGTIEEDYTGARTDMPYGVTGTLLDVNQVVVHLRAYSIANLRFGIRGEGKEGSEWSAALFVNNFTNSLALLDPQPQLSLQNAAFMRYVVSQPLTAGLDVSYRFK